MEYMNIFEKSTGRMRFIRKWHWINICPLQGRHHKSANRWYKLIKRDGTRSIKEWPKTCRTGYRGHFPNGICYHWSFARDPMQSSRSWGGTWNPTAPLSDVYFMFWNNWINLPSIFIWEDIVRVPHGQAIKLNPGKFESHSCGFLFSVLLSEKSLWWL